MNGLVNGTLTITAFDPESPMRHGTVELAFRNFPLDPPTVEFVSNMLVAVGVEATSVLTEKPSPEDV